MSTYLAENSVIIQTLLINIVMAYSVFIMLRGGLWSLHMGGAATLAAYTVAVLITEYGWSNNAAIWLLAILVATSASVMVLAPARKLTSTYLAVATIAFTQFVVVSTSIWEFTGGPYGIAGLDVVAGTGTIFVAALSVLVTVIVLTRSRLGSASLIYERSQELARALGASQRKLYLSLIGLSAVVAGAGGVMAAESQRVVVPGTFAFGAVISYFTFVIVGGIRVVWGPPLGALIFTALPYQFPQLVEYTLLLNGVVLFLAVRFAPLGLGDPATWRALRSAIGRSRPLNRRAAIRTGGAG